MKVTSIQVGKPRTFGSDEWCSGIEKTTVSGPVRVGKVNLDGDGQADLRVHGGPEKAICVYPEEHYTYWKEVHALELSPGGFGENFTTRGLLEADVCIGDIFRVGTALVQVSQPRQPCWKLAKRWQVKQLPLYVQETGRTGWYFRVLEEGTAQSGDVLELVRNHTRQWSITAANRVMHQDKTDWDAAQDLAECEGLSESWRASLLKRVEKKTIEDSSGRLGKRA